jgi:DNA polymerase-1
MCKGNQDLTESWLIIDGNYLCHRAFHAFRELSFDNARTGVVFGFLKDILYLRDLHGTQRFAFCFDHGRSLRCGMYAEYKGNRHREQTPEERAAFNELGNQIYLLKTRYLKELGFKNIFYEQGYEADDLIASLCQRLTKVQSGIIVSSDHDLFQLLSEQVCLWSPQRKQAVTHTSFAEEFGVTPAQWPRVKAIAGCKSDNIPGVVGVGEKTAAKYVRGDLTANSKAFQKIEETKPIWKALRGLVKLPFPGTPECPLQPDQLDQVAWRALTKRLGMHSITDRS